MCWQLAQLAWPHTMPWQIGARPWPHLQWHHHLCLQSLIWGVSKFYEFLVVVFVWSVCLTQGWSEHNRCMGCVKALCRYSYKLQWAWSLMNAVLTLTAQVAMWDERRPASAGAVHRRKSSFSLSGPLSPTKQQSEFPLRYIGMQTSCDTKFMARDKVTGVHYSILLHSWAPMNTLRKWYFAGTMHSTPSHCTCGKYYFLN